MLKEPKFCITCAFFIVGAIFMRPVRRRREVVRYLQYDSFSSCVAVRQTHTSLLCRSECQLSLLACIPHAQQRPASLSCQRLYVFIHLVGNGEINL
jgi:hypothetical protein